jgi:hypothetical protein
MRSGNGGQMSATKKQPGAGQAKKSAGAQKTAGSKAGRGSARLSKAADKALEANSQAIAKSLLASTLKGNVNSARLLVSLAESPEEKAAQGTKRRRSIAKALAAEPQWQPDGMEAAAETTG